MGARKISLSTFLQHVKTRTREQPDRPFCFILGSGASIESGIPTGARLVDVWLDEMFAEDTDGKVPLAQWATAGTLGIPGFTYEHRAEFYGDIYERKFRGMRDAGFHELEKTFAEKEPSFGYSVLAWILANSNHRVVITPNFDSLVADSLFIYSNVAPILCVHESLAAYVTHRLHRPLVVKFHRDLLFDPKSRKEEIAQLPVVLHEPLANLFRNFTPIVIGYGGNDPGFMKFLESLPEGVPDRLYWCVYESNPPNPRVQALLDARDGFLVPTLGFDRLMLRLREPLAVPDLVGSVEKRHADRMERYRKQLGDLLSETQGRSKEPGATFEVIQTAEAAVTAAQETKVEDTPRSWLLRARTESDKVKAEALYREALANHPNDGELMSAFGRFLADEKQLFKEGEELVKTAYEADPENAARLHDYGTFLWYSLGEGKRAEPFLRQALTKRTQLLGPEHPETLSSRNRLANAYYAQGNYGEAEQEHRAVMSIRARVLGAEHADTLASRNNLAAVLFSQRKYRESEQEHRALLGVRTRLLGVEHSETLVSWSNLAMALNAQGKHTEAEAENRARIAIEVALWGEDHADTLTSRNDLASTLADQGKHAEAEQEYRAVVAGRERLLGAEHKLTLACRDQLANSLSALGRYPEAEGELRVGLTIRARVLGPEHPGTLASRINLANALHGQGKFLEAEQEYRAALASWEKWPGVPDTDTLKGRMNLANTLVAQDKYAETEVEDRAVLAIQENLYGSEDFDVYRTCYNLAHDLRAQQKYAEALEFAQRAEVGWKRSLGDDDPRSKAAVDRRADIEAKLKGGG